MDRLESYNLDQAVVELEVQAKRITELEQRLTELEAIMVEMGWMDDVSSPPTRTNAPENWRYSISPSPYSILSVEEPHL